MESEYIVKENTFSLIDPQLGLHVHDNFILIKVPETIRKTTKINDETTIQVKKDDKGHVTEAFAEHRKKKHGQELTFYPNHHTKTEAYYKNGILHGPSTSYAKDGILLSQTWFVNGKQEGQSTWFYPDGTVYAIQRFRHGEFHQEQEYYYPDKTIKTRMHYKEGKLDGTVSIFSKTGQLEREITYADGVLVKKVKEVPPDVFTKKT